MAKLIIMKGLPASGKSTKAKELIEQYGNCIRINRDLLRTMLYFDEWTGRNEAHTIAAAQCLAQEFLRGGINVIIDDTNLNKGRLQSWVDLAKRMEAKLEYHKIETDVNECVKRDAARDKQVGRDVIVNMALQYGLYPQPAKGFVICDLDGTLCDIEWRLHHVKVPAGQKKDWKMFFAGIPFDKPRIDVLDKIDRLHDEGYEIIFVSGRPDTHRDMTRMWLTRYAPYWTTLIMRRGGDKRPDTETKLEIYNAFLKAYKVVKVIDDRPSVIRMWRDQGLEVEDVGNGVEF